MKKKELQLKKAKSKLERTEPMEVTDVRKGKDERRRAERLIKNTNFIKGSKFLTNSPEANEYRYSRKPQALLS